MSFSRQFSPTPWIIFSVLRQPVSEATSGKISLSAHGKYHYFKIDRYFSSGGRDLSPGLLGAWGDGILGLVLSDDWAGEGVGGGVSFD
jgi:hypothetical protein